MSPYCSAHDEWLIMKLCMYVGYHDANNVSNFGGDPVTHLNLKNVLKFNLPFCIPKYHQMAIPARVIFFPTLVPGSGRFQQTNLLDS